MFKHLKYNSTPSTQQELKTFLTQQDIATIPSFEQSKTPKILCSTLEQTQGFGRHGKAWVKTQSSLAFSFTLPQHNPPTLSSLFIPVVLAKFFAQYGVELKLKWPNDVLNDRGEKCGGILLQSSKTFFLVGVGINLKQAPIISRIQFPAGTLLTKDCDTEEILHVLESPEHDLPSKIYHFILEQFSLMQVEDIRREWIQHCAHLNLTVEIRDNDKIFEGVFTGVDLYGRALLRNEKTNGEDLITVSNGHLFISE